MYADLLSFVVRHIPELASAYESHKTEYPEGELPHIFFGEVTRILIDAHRTGNREMVTQIVNTMDLLLKTSDESVKNCVYVSFLENLAQAGIDYEAICESLTPDLTKALSELEADRIK